MASPQLVRQIYGYLVGKGLSPAGASGVIGNLIHESGLQTHIMGDGNTSGGIAQWHAGRLTNLKRFAQQRGKAWTDLGLQLDFLMHELNTSYKGVLRSLQRATTVGSAAKAFMDGFERPAVTNDKTSTAYRNELAARTRDGEASLTTAGGTTGGNVATTGALPDNATDAQIEAYIRKHYGDVAPFLAIPEIKRLLFKAARERYDEATLTGELQKTSWWRNNNSIQRNWAGAANDPAERKRLIRSMSISMANSLQEMYGRQVRTPSSLEAEAAKILSGRDSFESWLYRRTEAAKDVETSVYGQRLEEMTGDLRALSEDMLMNLDEQTLRRWAEDIQEGRSSQDDFEMTLRNLAATRWPGVAEQIEKGASPKALFGAYASTASEVLERTVDFTDPLVRGALSQPKDGMPMPLWEFEKQLRQRDEYRKTSGGLNRATEVAEFIGSKFGQTTS